MICSAIRCCSLALCAIAATLSAANAENVATARTVTTDIAKAAPDLPIEEILRELSARLGISFIYDSRLLSGMKIAPLANESRSIEPEKNLKRLLKQANLRIRKVSQDTYVITADDIGPAPIQTAGRSPAIPDTILVTASSSAASAMVGSSRLFEIDREQLTYVNAIAPDEIIFDLPQAIATTTPANTARLGAAAGLSLADLRGLAAQRTLVLVNGRRATPTIGAAQNIYGVDFNRFALPFVERIELESSSAGARLGDESVAGAVNVVLRSGLDGLETGAQFSVSERGDSEVYSLYAVGGHNFFDGAFNVSFGANFVSSDGIIGAERESTQDIFGFDSGAIFNPFLGVGDFLPGFGGFPLAPAGQFSGVLLNNGAFSRFAGFQFFVPGSDGSLEPLSGDPKHLSNILAPESLTPDIKKALGYLDISREFSSASRAFVLAHGGWSEGRYQEAPGQTGNGIDTGLGGAIVFPIDNPNLPQSIVDVARQQFGDAVQSVAFETAFDDLGPRNKRIDRRYFDLTGGVEFGRLPSGQFSLTYRFGHTSVKRHQSELINRDRLLTAIDPDRCSQSPDCAPADFFNPNGLSNAAAAYIRAPDMEPKYALTEHGVSAIAARSFDHAFSNRLRMRGGVTLRRASIEFADRADSGVVFIGGFGRANDANGAVNNVDFFGGADLEVTSGASPLGSFDVSVNWRSSISSVTETTVNFESGAKWRPLEGVSFFTHQFLGERAPNVVELFAVYRTAPIAVTDLCSPLFFQFVASEIARANCESGPPLGVDPGSSPIVDFFPAITDTGNSSLRAEDNRSASYGVTLAPSEWMSGFPGALDVTATWLNYRIKNAIVDFNDSFNECFESVGFSAPACGINPTTGNPTIVRDPHSGQLDSVENFLVNSSELSWRGLDLELRYAFEPFSATPIKRVWMNIAHTYTRQASIQTGDGATQQLLGSVNYPRHETYLQAGIQSGRFGLAFNLTRRGEVRSDLSFDVSETKIAATFYADTSIRFNLTEKAYLQFGVENLLNRDPPIAAFISFHNTFPNFYDVVGRRFSLSARVQF